MIIRLIGEGTRDGLLDLATGRLVERTEPVSTESRHDGWYRSLAGQLVALYCVGDQAWVRIGDVAQACSSPADISWVRQDNGVARLSLVDGEEISASVVYFGGDTSGIPPELDFTMADSEDFDFGEFVSRRLKSPSALARVAGATIRFDPTARRLPGPTRPLRRFLSRRSGANQALCVVLMYLIIVPPVTHRRTT